MLHNVLNYVAKVIIIQIELYACAWFKPNYNVELD